MSNFKPVTNFWFWCQKVLPLVYDDSISYYEVLCKMSDYLNQVINNVNALPDIIDEAVKEYIESGEIQKVLNEMLQNFNPINVKNPPADLAAAKGDGETDDTAALQAMIEYGAEHDLPMIFPAGVYRVSSLNVPEKAYFLGTGEAVLFKAPNTDDAVINVSKDFTAFNMTFNGNIAGNIAPVNAAQGTCENISFSHCHFTDAVSCIDIVCNNYAEIISCEFSNYTGYAVYVSGNGQLVANNLAVSSVANSGALGFVVLETNDSVLDTLISNATVPTGVAISGNNNYVKCRIPNAVTPVNDTGENNSYTAIGQAEKKSLLTLAENIAENSEENVGSTKTLKAKDIILQPENPLTYKTPEDLNQFFKSVPFKDLNGNNYDVLVKNESVPFIFVEEYGAKGDGSTDDTAAIFAAADAAMAARKTLMFSRNKTYCVKPTSPHNVYNVDFNGATIKLLPGTTDTLFMMEPINSYPDTTITQENIAASGVNVSSLFNKSFLLKAPISMGQRYGTGDTFYMHRYCVCDGIGRFTNGFLDFDVVDGAYSVTDIQDAYTEQTFCKNGIIEYSSENPLTCIVGINRNNVLIDNFVINGISAESENFTSAVFANNCTAYVQISNIMGNNPAPLSTGGYVVASYYVTDFRYINIRCRSNSGGSWGAFGANFIHNGTVIDCSAIRWDVHYAQTGFLTVKNCVFGYAYVAGGTCNITFENCIINAQDVNSAILCRDDLSYCPGGLLNIINCTLSASNWLISLIANATDGVQNVYKNLTININGLRAMTKTPVINVNLGSAFTDININIENVQNALASGYWTYMNGSDVKLLTFKNCVMNSPANGSPDKVIIDSCIVTLSLGNTATIKNLIMSKCQYSGGSINTQTCNVIIINCLLDYTARNLGTGACVLDNNIVYGASAGKAAEVNGVNSQIA